MVAASVPFVHGRAFSLGVPSVLDNADRSETLFGLPQAAVVRWLASCSAELNWPGMFHALPCFLVYLLESIHAPAQPEQHCSGMQAATKAGIQRFIWTIYAIESCADLQWHAGCVCHIVRASIRCDLDPNVC